jgi:hypothetical protein
MLWSLWKYEIGCSRHSRSDIGVPRGAAPWPPEAPRRAAGGIKNKLW